MGGNLETALARHAEAVATVRAFARQAGALRVVLLVDCGDGRAAAMLDCGADGALELAEHESRWSVPAGTPVTARPRSLPELRPPPSSSLTIDPGSG